MLLKIQGLTLIFEGNEPSIAGKELTMIDIKYQYTWELDILLTQSCYHWVWEQEQLSCQGWHNRGGRYWGDKCWAKVPAAIVYNSNIQLSEEINFFHFSDQFKPPKSLDLCKEINEVGSDTF